MKYTQGAKEPEREILPEGDYEITVTAAEETMSKAGAEMIKLTLLEEEKNAVFYDYLILKESSFWKIDQFRRAIGDSVKDGEDIEIDVQEWVGKSAKVHVRVEEWVKGDSKGKSNKVARWLSKDGTGNEPF